MDNAVTLQGVKALIMNNTTGDLLMIGHSTSGEISMLANGDPDLRARMKGRYIGWGSGGPARMDNVRLAKEGRGGSGSDAGAVPPAPRAGSRFRCRFSPAATSPPTATAIAAS